MAHFRSRGSQEVDWVWPIIFHLLLKTGLHPQFFRQRMPPKKQIGENGIDPIGANITKGLPSPGLWAALRAAHSVVICVAGALLNTSH